MVIYISTPQQLQDINNNLTETYELVNDIDMSGFPFTPLGRVYPFFSGHLNGKGFKIKNLRVVSTIEYTGFIARTNGGVVENLGLEDVYIESNNHHVGGLVALNSLSERISNCYVTGTIKQTNSSKLYCGGLVGRNYGNVNDCYSDCIVSGGDSVGGFSGVINYTGSTIKNCYSKSTVSGSKNIGAFFGTSETTVVYENNFYDSQLAGVSQSSRTGVVGKTSSEMQTQSTYLNWDFTNIWYMSDYPKLRLFASEIPTQPKLFTVTLDSHFKTPSVTVDVSKRKLQISLSSTHQIKSNVSKRLITNVTSTVEQLLSSIEVKENANIKTYTVHSKLIVIDSNVDTSKKVVKVLTSVLEPIQSLVEVIIPIDVERPIYANVYAISNDTNTFTLQNPTNTYEIENHTRLEVI
ncbi:MAG TPA: GLUG motif-containing protein [Niallia sp.]|nr:GLUG motif-containing protein [Niallia sp.]